MIRKLEGKVSAKGKQHMTRLKVPRILLDAPSYRLDVPCVIIDLSREVVLHVDFIRLINLQVYSAAPGVILVRHMSEDSRTLSDFSSFGALEYGLPNEL